MQRFWCLVLLVIISSCDAQKLSSNRVVKINSSQSEKLGEVNSNLTIKNNKDEVVYEHPWFASNGFDLEDFDNNGLMDIRLYQISNIGGISELIFFDTQSHLFKQVENFDNFSDPIKIANSKYWYSYHRSGCADINWGSLLFTIENYKAIRIGEIRGIGCDGEPENGIFIYKSQRNDDNLDDVKVFTQLREPEFYGDKWDFIQKYWNKNYQMFE